MLILLVCLSVALGVASWYLLVESENTGLGVCLLCLLLPLWVVPMEATSPPEIAYPYQATVLDLDSQTPSRVYFSTYSQTGYKITLDTYAVWTIHWTDFKFYDLKTNLEITLTDNDNKFTYKNRETGQVVNPASNKATQ